MKAEITSIQKRGSKYGGEVYLVTFKSEKGESLISWIDPENRNWIKWQNILKVGNFLDGLNIKKDNIVDADSRPIILN